MRKTADLGGEQYPDAAKVIKRGSYVDDLLTSVEKHDRTMALMLEIEKILKRGGFDIKHWIVSKQKEECEGIKCDVEVKTVDSIGEKVLGMIWNPKEVVFQFKVHLDFTKSKKGRTDRVDLTEVQIIEEPPKTLTLRLVLGQIAKVYDPLGLVLPYILEGKLLLRKTFTRVEPIEEKMRWDSPISEELYGEWMRFFASLFALERMKFERCLKTKAERSRDRTNSFF